MMLRRARATRVWMSLRRAMRLPRTKTHATARPPDRYAESNPGFPKTAVLSNATGMTVSTESFSVPGGGRLLVAIVGLRGQYAGAGVWPVTLAGGGLTWTNRVQFVSRAPAIQTRSASASGPPGTGRPRHPRRWWRRVANNVPADAILSVYSLAEEPRETAGATGGGQQFEGPAVPVWGCFREMRAQRVAGSSAASSTVRVSLLCMAMLGENTDV